MKIHLINSVPGFVSKQEQSDYMSPFLIAEVGINHNGDINVAKQLIEAAHVAGFDAVKFQKRTIDRVYTADELERPRESPWGTTMREQKEGLEFGLDAYREIDAYCRSLGIYWSASAWDLDALEFLNQFDLPFHKIASARLGHTELLSRTAAQGRKTFISTGMTTIDEIDRVVDIFRAADCPFELMHCNSTYPMKEADANLTRIATLRDRYQCDVGYSGHEVSLIKICVTAVALGATSIERHITLDRTMYGSDQAASVEVHALPNLVQTIRAIPTIIGEDKTAIYESEVGVRNKLWRETDL
jgi:N-acetylneuraminate synthase